MAVPAPQAPRNAPLSRIQSLPSWLAGRVAARGRGLVAGAIAEQGLNPAQLAVLAAAAEQGPLAQADLARRLSIDAKDMVLLLNHLEQAGLVAREPDPRDRRKNAIRVTPRGSRMLERCVTLAEQANAELLAPLDAAERRQLITLLTRLHDGDPGGTD